MAGKRVLVIDDDVKTTELVKLYLRRDGYKVVTAYDGLQAVDVARETHPDLVVLDLMLPGLDGFEVFRALRAESDVPIIMLTAKTTEQDRLNGLDLGADDYVTKPFSHIELIARVHAVLRRVQESPVTTEDRPFASGKLWVDFSSNAIKVDGEPVKLTSTEFKLLQYLIRNEGRLLSHENLLAKVWGDTYGDARDLLRVHIQHLRRKLGDSIESPKIIVTEHGMGYKFVHPQ